MTTHPSTSSQDPTLLCAYFGGPRDGLRTADLPSVMSGEKLTGLVSKVPLSQPHEFSLYAVYECTSDRQVEGFWHFLYRGLEGPNGEVIGVAELNRSPQWGETPSDAEPEWRPQFD